MSRLGAFRKLVESCLFLSDLLTVINQTLVKNSHSSQDSVVQLVAHFRSVLRCSRWNQAPKWGGVAKAV